MLEVLLPLNSAIHPEDQAFNGGHKNYSTGCGSCSRVWCLLRMTTLYPHINLFPQVQHWGSNSGPCVCKAGGGITKLNPRFHSEGEALEGPPFFPCCTPTPTPDRFPAFIGLNYFRWAGLPGGTPAESLQIAGFRNSLGVASQWAGAEVFNGGKSQFEGDIPSSH